MKLLQTKIVKFSQRLGGKCAKSTIFRRIHNSKNSLGRVPKKTQGTKTISFLKIGIKFETF